LGPVPADFFSAHIECFNSLSHTSVGANAVDMNLVFINVVDDEIWGIQSDNSFVVAPNFDSEYNGPLLLVNKSHYFTEVFVFHFGAKGAPVDFISHTLLILWFPLWLIVAFFDVIIFAHWGNQVWNKRNDSRSKAAFCQQVHF
jgi:hypothetical protein